MLVVTKGWMEVDAYWVEKGIAVCLLLLIIWLFIKPTILNTSLLVLFLVVFAVIVYENAGKPNVGLSFLTSSAKWILPILYLLVYKKIHEVEFHFPKWLFPMLKVSLFVIFFVHGLSCFLMHPVFIDYIIGLSEFFTNNYIKQSTAETILIIIGIIDVAIAFLILIKPLKWVLIWMIIWGFLTSFLRIVDGSIFNYTEFLIRMPHFIIPLVYLMLLQQKHLQNNSLAGVN
jgi:hypothetical protein